MTRPIKDLMAKYQSLEPSDRKIKRAIRKALLDVCGVDLPETYIQIQQKTVFLTMHPIEKKELLKRKSTIIDEVEKLLGIRAIEVLK